MTDSIIKLGAAEIAAKIASGELTAVEVTEAHLARIEAIDEKVHAFLHVDREGALAQARAVDEKRERGEELGPLAGVPLALKDIFTTEGIPTTVGSKILEGWIPPYDATLTKRLKAADVVILGKTNMDEFAMGSSTENSAFNPTCNPWARDCVPGGSSGGSAVAVAAGEALGALGTDTGGSIRQPAAFCGVTGLKPTYGRVSRYCALMLEAIAGADPHDGTAANAVVPNYAAQLDGDIRGIRIGVPGEYFVEGMDPNVAARVSEAIRTLRDLGAEIVDVSLPHTRFALPAYYIIAPAEASANLARFNGVRYGLRLEEPGESIVEMYGRTRGEGFGAEVKRRIMLGSYALSAGYYEAYYGTAQKVRTLIRRDFDRAFADVDLIATPTSPTGAFRIGERVDLQLIGPAFSENRILAAGHARERALGVDPVPPLMRQVST